MNNDLMSILQCPITKRDLRAMTSLELREFNERGSSGDMFHLDGTSLRRSVTEALITSDGGFAYLVEDQIALMLADLAVPLTAEARNGTRTIAFSADKRSVQAFYNEIGWQKGDKDATVDANKYEDLR